MHLRCLIFVMISATFSVKASPISTQAASTTTDESKPSTLHPRTVPISFSENIATGIARVQRLYPQAHLLSINGYASPRTRSGLTTKWEPPRKVELKFDAEDDPTAKSDNFGQAMGLELYSKPEWGKWSDKPYQYYSYAALAKIDWPFDWNEVFENGQTSFEDAVMKLTTKMGVTEKEWIEGKFSIFARPKRGFLANSLPQDVYYMFELWGKDGEGKLTLNYVYMGVFSGDTFVNPKPGNSGILRRLSVDWNPFDQDKW